MNAKSPSLRVTVWLNIPLPAILSWTMALFTVDPLVERTLPRIMLFWADAVEISSNAGMSARKRFRLPIGSLRRHYNKPRGKGELGIWCKTSSWPSRRRFRRSNKHLADCAWAIRGQARTPSGSID